MKKFISVVLALTMIISMFATASAATMKETLVDTYGIPNPYVLSDELPISISAKRSGGSEYSASPLSIIDSNLSNGIGVDYKTTLDMSLIKALFNKDLIDVIINDPSASVEFYTGKVTTDVEVTITYPATAVFDESYLLLPTTGTLDNATFTHESRTISTDGDKKIAKIKYKNTDGLTVDNLDDNNYAALNDITFTLENAIKYNTTGDHIVTVTMEGETTITYGDDTPGNSNDDIAQVIKYKGATANYTVSINAPSTGGGSSYNTIKLVTNGGNELKNISVRRGGKVSELPVPVREGYVFTGWYTDSALKTPFDEDTVINKNYTLYAAWVEDSGTVEIVHETPEMLNGEDHFAYVLGYPDGTVRPNANITRAEVTSIFFRLLKDEVREENLTNDNSFNDVNGEDWYNTAVSTMAKLGIVNGRTADEFVPNANITRAEFAAICARFDESQYSIVDKFTDIISHWAEDEIHETAAYGWIKGYEDGTFKPDKAITRAEAMTMINRVLNRVPETADDLLSDMIVWPDNSESDWYYLPVQEATNGHNYEMKNNIYEKWTEITDVTDWTKYE